MAIILIEEVLMGLDEVKASLEQALTTLDVLVEDLSPTLGEALRTELEQTLRQAREQSLPVHRNAVTRILLMEPIERSEAMSRV